MNTQTQEALKMIDAIQIKYSDLIHNEAGFEKAEEFEDNIIAIKEALATNKESSLVQPAQEPSKVDLYFAVGFVMGIVFYQIQKYFL
jgi:hypothetical protein